MHIRKVPRLREHRLRVPRNLTRREREKIYASCYRPIRKICCHCGRRHGHTFAGERPYGRRAAGALEPDTPRGAFENSVRLRERGLRYFDGEHVRREPFKTGKDGPHRAGGRLTGVEACTHGERRQGGGGARHRPLRQAFEAVR